MYADVSPWFETVAVLAVVFTGFAFGLWFSKLPKQYWLIGYFVPLGLIFLYTLALFQPRLGLIPPISWMMTGRNRFGCFAFAAVMMLSTPLTRLPQKRNRVVLCLLMVVLTCVSLVPFLAPAFNRGYLARLKTRIDADGVCHQSNDYTCGPAAAVTALRQLGVEAEEGEIALLSHTSSLTGTEPDILAKVLQKRYGADGVEAEYRAFHDIEELKAAGLTVAVVKFNFMLDHCVTVLRVENEHVIVGDPLSGLAQLSISDFKEKWQYVGVVLKRVPR